MPSTPSPSLRVVLQATGEGLNVWGQKLNDEALLGLEQAICGVLIKPLTGNCALTVQNYVSDEARNATLIFTNGGLSTAPTVTVPPAPKSWHVDNRCGFPITFTMGGTPVTVPVGRQADVFCDGANLFMLEPIAAASAVTEAFATQAAFSATSAASSAGTATTAKNAAISARDETYTARDTTLAYRNTTLGYRDEAASSASAAAASAAGVNLPSVSVSDAGKALTVKPDGSGYQPTSITVAKATQAERWGLSSNTAVNTPLSDALAMQFVPVNINAPQSIQLNLGLGFNVSYNLSGNLTLSQPVNGKDGTPVILRFVQDATGSRTISFNTTFNKFPGGLVPSLSTAPGSLDRLAGICVNRSGTLVMEWSGIEKDIK